MVTTTELMDGLDLPSLTRWMDSKVPGGLASPLTGHLLVGGRSNPTYALSDGTREWVLRRQPLGQFPSGAHDMGREFTILSALAPTAVPVPAVVGLEREPGVLDASFYVMERLEGQTLRTQSETSMLTEEQRRAVSESLLDTLVALHSVEPASVGLQDWGRPEGYLERQVDRWDKQWAAACTVQRPEFNLLIKRLRRATPISHYPGILHGDYKIDNVMVAHDDPTRIVGVLDWEMATRGDTLADLGLLISFWDEEGKFFNPVTAGATALPGFLSSHEVIEGYVRRRDIPVDGLDWYIVLADLKVAVVLEQIHARFLRGETVGDGFSDVGDMVGPLIERALERAEASPDRALRGA